MPFFSVLYSVFKDTSKSNSTAFDLLFVRVQAEVKPGVQEAAELSEAARCELFDLCEDQFAQLEKVKPCLNLRHPFQPVSGCAEVVQTADCVSLTVCVAASE